MAIGSSTSTPVSRSLFAQPTSGSASSFLNSTDVSPVQQMLNNQKKAQETKTSYFESEDFLRMKAFEIRSRIVLYQNLGLTKEYQMAQQEGAEVVKKYQAILAKKQADDAAKALEKQITSQLV